MSERYTKLFSLPPDLYAEGSPLVISAGNLLKDNQTGQILAQLKIKNISPKMVKAVIVAIHALDTAGRPIDGDATREYLDLAARQGAEFGQKTAIFLPNPSTRGFTVTVREAVFEDNSAYESTDAPWEPLPAATALSSTLGDAELVKQYQLAFGGPCQVAPRRHKDLWQCACGTWNPETACFCYGCQKSRNGLFDLDLEALKADRDARLAQEKAAREAKAAAEKAAAEKAAEKAKKVTTTLAICIAAVALCVGAFFLIAKVLVPNSRYNKAKALFESGQYEEAVTAFEAMNGYKDSAAQIKAAKEAIAEQERLQAEEERRAEEARIEAEKNAAYEKAAALQAAGQFEEAIEAYTAMNGYRDSAAQIENCKTSIQDRAYDAAVALLNEGKTEEAYLALIALNGYRDSAEIASETFGAYKQTKLQNAKVGEYVLFGRYEQDNDASNGKEDVEWIVLARESDRILVLSRYGLDCQPYHSSQTSVTWETCSLRKWLNGVFISSTFEPDEQAKLQSTTVTADKNPSYTTTSPGKDTKDKVFLLSIAQINTYLKANPEKTCQATAYAIRKGAYTTSGNENCRWWLRSPGAESDLAAYIKVAGGIDDYGKGVSVDNCTIRPAMWISLG